MKTDLNSRAVEFRHFLRDMDPSGMSTEEIALMVAIEMKFDQMFGPVSVETEEEEIPVLVGYLTRRLGTKKFKTIEIGTPVFEFRGMYLLDTESEDGKIKNQAKYYKETLKPCICFQKEPLSQGQLDAYTKAYDFEVEMFFVEQADKHSTTVDEEKNQFYERIK